jgi:hypothetical protein
MVKEMQANTRIQPVAQENHEEGFSTLRAAPNFYQIGGGVQSLKKIFVFPSNKKEHLGF